MKSACKQLPLAESDDCRALICVKNPADSTVSEFVCKTLPFGAVGSVFHFNRFARFVKRVLLELQIMTTNYFDDYPVIALEALRWDTEQTGSCVMQMFGIATAADKDDVVDLLGVTVDVSDSAGQSVKVSNQRGRIEDRRRLSMIELCWSLSCLRCLVGWNSWSLSCWVLQAGLL